jgi:hypothetical protein
MSMNLSSFKKLTIGGIELKQLFIGGVQAWKSGYKNWAHHAIDTDGSIYNGGKGYINGQRLSSGGTIKEMPNSTTTGFIPIKSGDVVRIGGYPWYSTTSALNYFNLYNSSFGLVKARTSENITLDTSVVSSAVINGDITEITIANNANIAYCRANYYGENDNIANVTGANLIVTVNEEIT